MTAQDGQKLAIAAIVFSLAACSGGGVPGGYSPASTANKPSATSPASTNAIVTNPTTDSQTRTSVSDATGKTTMLARPTSDFYNKFVLAMYPDFYYETNELDGSVVVDSSPYRNTGSLVSPVLVSKTGCCGNNGIEFLPTSAGTGKMNAQITTPIPGSNHVFNDPFTLGMSITPTVASYPGYGTYWYAGTDATENGTGNGWDFEYGNNNAHQVAGYNVNWRYGGASNLLYPHALITGNHQWVIAVSASSVSLFLDGRQVATAKLTAPFQVNSGRENLSFGNTAIDDQAAFNCACSMSSLYFVPKALTAIQIDDLQTAAIQSSPIIVPSTQPSFGPTPGGTPILPPTPPATATPSEKPTSTPTGDPTSGPTAKPTATPTPAPSGTPGGTGVLTYNSSTACVNHAVFTNNVLPANVGEFATSGFNTSFWGGTKSRTYNPTATWGPGFYQSWGRHQYDTDMGDPTQGAGFPNPFAMVADQGTQALRISAYPVPAPIATSLDLMQNDQYIVANATTSYAVPTEGGSLSVNVDNVNGAQNGWKVGIGFQGAATTFIGTLTHGGATPSVGGGGSNPWTISNIHVYTGTPGTVITPSQNPNNYALRSYNFPAYYSGTLDANVNQEYGFFVARLRLPQPAPGLSPAFWMLETGGVKTNNGQLMRSEWDVEEMFGAAYQYELNAGNILWNSGNSGPWFSYGCGISCGSNGQDANGATGVYPWASTGNYNSQYHDYGVLVSPGGPAFPTNYSGSLGGTYTASNSPYVGTTFFVDGVPVAGHIGAPDLTQGSPDKEIMLMFQVAAPGTWLDPNNQAKNNVWPQYMYAQWIRAYKPTSSSC